MRECNLKANGHDVTVSHLTQRPHRAAPADLLLNITPGNREVALAVFQRAGELGGIFSGLRITGIADLGFLKDFPDLLYLELDGLKKKVDMRGLDCLSNLPGLSIWSPGAGLDFACFPDLEGFFGDWHPDNRNLEKCQELRRLHLWHFNPPARDLSPLVGLTRLEDLGVIQSNLGSLAGIESLEDLRYLHIAYASKLESLDALARHESAIREIEFDVAKRIESYRPLSAIPRLRRLKLSSCAPMPNLIWTAGMNHLDFFSFVDTNVIDGDLSPLLGLPLLRYVGTLDKKHYSHKADALRDALKQRWLDCRDGDTL